MTLANSSNSGPPSASDREYLLASEAAIEAKKELIHRLPGLLGVVGAQQFCAHMKISSRQFYAAANHEGRLAYFPPEIVSRVGREIGTNALPESDLLSLVSPSNQDATRVLCAALRPHGSWSNRYRIAVLARIDAVSLTRREKQALLSKALAVDGAAHLGRLIFGRKAQRFQWYVRDERAPELSPKDILAIQRAVGQAVPWEVVASIGTRQRRHLVAAELRRIYRKGAKVHPRALLDARLRELEEDPNAVLDDLVPLLGYASRNHMLMSYRKSPSILDRTRRQDPGHAWTPNPFVISLQRAVGSRMHPDRLVMLASQRHRLDLYQELLKIYEAALQAESEATSTAGTERSSPAIEVPTAQVVWQRIGAALGLQANQTLARALKIHLRNVRDSSEPTAPLKPRPLALEVVEYLARVTRGTVEADALLVLLRPGFRVVYRDRVVAAVEQAKTDGCELRDPKCTERAALIREVQPLLSCDCLPQMAVSLGTTRSYLSAVAYGEANFSDETLGTLAVLLEGKVPRERLLICGAPWKDEKNLEAMRVALLQKPEQKAAIQRQALFGRMLRAVGSTNVSAIAQLIRRSTRDFSSLLMSGHSVLGVQSLLELRAQLRKRRLWLTRDDCRILCMPSEYSTLCARLDVLELPKGFANHPPAWLVSLREKLVRCIPLAGDDAARLAECETRRSLRRFLALKVTVPKPAWKPETGRNFQPSAKLLEQVQKAVTPYDVWWVMLEDPRVKEVEKLAEVFGEESTTLMGLLPVGQFWPTEEQVLKAIAFFNYIPEDKVRMLCEKARRPAPMTNEKFRRGTASPNPAPNPDEAHD